MALNKTRIFFHIRIVFVVLYVKTHFLSPLLPLREHNMDKIPIKCLRKFSAPHNSVPNGVRLPPRNVVLNGRAT